MFKRQLRGLLDIIYPPSCAGCKKPLKNTHGVDAVACPACWAAIKKNRPPFCQRCGRAIDWKVSGGKVCKKCLRKELHFDRAFSACIYDGLTKELIHKFKYQGHDHLSSTLSGLLIGFIREFNLPPLEYFDLLMPIPLSQKKLREREFNQSQLLACDLSKEFGLKLCADNLLRVRDTKTQTELPDERRFLNVKDSFALSDAAAIKDKMIILIDDVLTTGATCSEAARVLKDNGARTVFALTIAS
ncbi:MAG: ComF family protein [Candidatus Omnitrophica bacterium]|nr:ComF family protein [Candidatus Omnitrophota bacterium]MDD5237144.1 ComF family protein [Candidatus Omnitrophota bacterium]MDD5611301.1 ComF family protein [Candidatus Omnitrophota bacterium]